MRILFIVPYVPNMIRVRPYNLIKALTTSGHQVTVLTIVTNAEERQDVQDLEPYCEEVHFIELPLKQSILNSVRAFLTPDPLQSYYSWSPALFDLVEDMEQFDVVHVEHLRGVRYALYVREKHPNLPVVWDSVDCITHLFRQASQKSRSTKGALITRIDLSRTAKFEGRLVNELPSILVTSDTDRDALLELQARPYPTANISVLPNGVDLEYFHPPEDIKRESQTLVVSGKMSYHANITMVLFLVNEVMPLIWDQLPETKLYIVGKDPVSEIEKLGEHPCITVTGTVDDMRPFVQRATVSVAPVVYGAGIQNKVLEAMACQTPVVTTPQTAHSIAAIADKEFCVAGDAATFANKTLLLLKDPKLANKIGQSGFAFIQRQHDWLSVAAKLEEVYSGVIHRQ